MYWNIVESVLTNNEFEESQSYTEFIVVTKDIMVILDLKMIFLRCKTRSSTWLDVKICAKYTYNAVPAFFFFFQFDLVSIWNVQYTSFDSLEN